MLPIAALIVLVVQDTPAVYSGLQRQTAVRPPRIEASIQVDGSLDEPAWRQAARLSGFSQYQPVDSRPAEEETEVLVWYSPTAIHFGIRARESHGEGLIRATRADRDNIGNDDHIQILLDTYNDRRTAFLFGVNPFGVQQDGTRNDNFAGGAGGGSGAGGGGGFNPLDGNVDLNPDYVWESRGRLTEGGFEVEIRIPFKSLRYGSGAEQTWGINVLRRVRHNGYQDSWTPAVRANASFIGQSGTLEGLTDLRRGLVMELTPFATGRSSGSRPASGFGYVSDDTADVGLNARWGITQNLSMDLTLNPDFSQVEADVGQVTINERFALFFPEKRPFFLDGLELFDTPGQLIYTRRIVSPDWGLKLAGRIGRTNVGALLAQDDEVQSFGGAHPRFAVARLRTDVTPSLNFGVVGTAREDGDFYSRLLGIDSRLYHNRLYFIEAQAVRSWSRDPAGRGNGEMFQLSWDRTGRRWGFNYGVNAVSPRFEAAAGFVNRTGFVSAHAFNRQSFYGRRGALLETVSFFLGVQRLYDYDTFSPSRSLEGSENLFTQLSLRGGWRLNISPGRNFFSFDPAGYGSYRVAVATVPPAPTYAAFVPPAGISNLVGFNSGLTTPTFRHVTGSASLTYGEAALFEEASEGRMLRTSVAVDWRPTTQVRVGFSYAHVRFTRERDGSELSRQDIPRLKIEYQATRNIFFRFVGQYTATQRDSLRAPDGAPFLIRSAQDSTVNLNGRVVSNSLRADWLFSYRPSPGTLVYVGYGSSLYEPDAFAFSTGRMRRQNDGWFAKVSYLWRI
ncbi:MAG TPA: DUF5916 domain-containing protein [Gemmatimonadales bacterium]|nr:DUF5916 domain-containing protein [Gemmatimonadales bacterium]